MMQCPIPSWFKRLYIRALQCYIICFRTLFGKLKKNQLIWGAIFVKRSSIYFWFKTSSKICEITEMIKRWPGLIRDCLFEFLRAYVLDCLGTHIETTLQVVTWLGWMNSCMNPCIYACCSKDFNRWEPDIFIRFYYEFHSIFSHLTGGFVCLFLWTPSFEGDGVLLKWDLASSLGLA